MGASGWEYYVPYQVDLTAALRDLRAQVQTWIGSGKPTRADFERAHQDGGLVELIEERWTGCCTVLFTEDGEPAEIAFWGISGD